MCKSLASIGNVSYRVLIKSALGIFFPVFGDGNTLTAILVASVGIRLFHFLILRGVKQAAFVNTVVAIAKVVPISGVPRCMCWRGASAI